VANHKTKVKNEMNNVVVTGADLTLEQLTRVARGTAKARISQAPEVRERINASAAYVIHAVQRNLKIYGVTTGVGGMSQTPLTAEQAGEFQNNLLCFLRCGAGGRLPNADVRAAMLLRMNSLSRGVSGIRYELIERIERFLNEGVTPHVYEFGSIGASGDLVPLSHIAGALIGLNDRCRVDFRGEDMDAVSALRRLGLPRITLLPKEGLALVNGTSMMTAMAANCLTDAQELFALTLGAHGLMFQAMRASNQSFHPFIHAHKPHPGQLHAAREMLRLLEGASFIRDESPGGLDADATGLAQDRYSLRCLPQFVGPIIEGFWHSADQLEIEMNSANDNPLIDAQRQTAYHGGNFLGQYVGMAMDQLRSHLGLLAKHLDAQVALLNAPEFNGGLPGSLVGNAERPVNMGLKGLQIVGNSLMPLLTFFGNTFVDRFPTHAEQFNQNINSQGFGAAWLARQSVEIFRQYIAVALLFGVQAVDLRAHAARGTYDPRLYLSPVSRGLYEAVRLVVGHPNTPDAPLIRNDDEQSLDEYLRRIRQDIVDEGAITQSALQTKNVLAEH
jgi:phenylalanine ammonia-lyase